MRGNIMYTKWQSVSYAVQKRFNEWFSRIIFTDFAENKYTNLKRYWTTFFYKTDYSPYKIAILVTIAKIV